MPFIEVDGSGFIFTDAGGFIETGESAQGPTMSDSLDDVIDIQITVTDKSPSRPSFGIPLIAAYHTAWVDRVREYSDADDLLDDGFSTSSHVYKMAQAVKSQDPSPNIFKVGRIATATVQTIHLIPVSTTQGFVYSGTINGQAFTYTVGAAATIQVIVEAVAPIIAALTGVAATEDNTKIIVVTDTSGARLDYTITPRTFNVIDATPDPGIAADLAAINDEDDDWYGLVIDTNSEATIVAASGWIETKRKVFFPQSADWDVIDSGQTTDVASVLVTSAYNRTCGMFHRQIGGAEWSAAAFISSFLVRDPGTATPAHKTLAGIAADNLRAGEISSLKTKRFTRYTATGGVNVTFEGLAPSGRFIDVTRDVDWLHSEMQNDLFSLLLNNPKVPYTASGISAVKGTILGTLKRATNRGMLDPDTTPTVTVPAIADTSAADRAARILRDVKFTARLAGALHSIRVTGTISV